MGSIACLPSILFLGLSPGVTDAVLASWSPPFGLTLLVVVATVLYVRGWRRLHRQVPTRFPLWRLVCYLTGLGLMWASVASPIDGFAGLLLQVHMVQHVILMMVAPPLILAGQPMLPLLRGLPRAWVRDGLGPLFQAPPVRAAGRFLTHPVVAWILYAAATLVWHWPPAYELALRSETWHWVEHACFFVTAILFWWPVMLPWPARPQMRRWAAIPYLLAADMFNTAVAGFISFYERPLYPSYQLTAPLFGTTALDDQAAAGAIMWVPGSLAYLIPAALVAVEMLSPKWMVRPTPARKQPPKTSQHARQPATGWVWKLVKSRATRRTVQAILLLLAIAVVVDGFWGPQSGALNLAGVLPWTYWRGFAVIALLAAGNFFCFGCPFILARDGLRRWWQPRHQWPRWLRSKWPAIVLLVAFFIGYEVYALWDRPAATAWLILGYFTGALVIDGLFRGASFCQYVCPVGQYQMLMSHVSPLEVKARSLEVCGSCKTHDCLRGNEQDRGCELHLFLPRKRGSMDCTFCLDCARACPHDNVALAPVAPGQDLADPRRRSTVGAYERRLDLAALIALFTFAAIVNAAMMLAPVRQWLDGLTAYLGLATDTLPMLGVLLLALLVVPFFTAWISAGLSRRLGRLEPPVPQVAGAMLPLLVPVGAAMWAAHFLFHLVTGWSSLWIPLQRIGESLGWLAGAAAWQPPALGWVSAWLLPMEFLLLDLGVLLSFYLIWKRSRRFAAGHPVQRAAGIALPWLLVAALLWMAGLWIVLQPMEMRGTMMAG